MLTLLLAPRTRTRSKFGHFLPPDYSAAEIPIPDFFSETAIRINSDFSRCNSKSVGFRPSDFFKETSIRVNPDCAEVRYGFQLPCGCQWANPALPQGTRRSYRFARTPTPGDLGASAAGSGKLLRQNLHPQTSPAVSVATRSEEFSGKMLKLRFVNLFGDFQRPCAVMKS